MQAMFLGSAFELVIGHWIVETLPPVMAEGGVVIQRDLRVQRA